MSNITKDEFEKIQDLLHSEHVTDIMTCITTIYASYSNDTCNHLLSLIAKLSTANIKRMEDDLALKQKAVETLEYMLPAGMTYPFGKAGAIAFVYSQMNFHKMWLNSRKEFTHTNMVTAAQFLRSSPGARATLPIFRQYIDECSANSNWKDDVILNQFQNSDLIDMIEWCIANRDKWDDMQEYLDQQKMLNQCQYTHIKNKQK